MSSVTIGVIGVGIFLILSLLGFPIASGMLLTGVVGFGVLTNFNAAVNLIAVDLFSSVTSYNMSVVAMFTWMGYLALHSGIGARLFDFAYKMSKRTCLCRLMHYVPCIIVWFMHAIIACMLWAQ